MRLFKVCHIRRLARRIEAGTLGIATMPTADATLLPPPLSASSFDDEPPSVRSLDDVDVETVLGAMIDHRRASQPSLVAPSGVLEHSSDNLDAHMSGTSRTSEVFLKAR
jgi:hypothetical protein